MRAHRLLRTFIVQQDDTAVEPAMILAVLERALGCLVGSARLELPGTPAGRSHGEGFLAGRVEIIGKRHLDWSAEV